MEMRFVYVEIARDESVAGNPGVRESFGEVQNCLREDSEHSAAGRLQELYKQIVMGGPFVCSGQYYPSFETVTVGNPCKYSTELSPDDPFTKS